MAEGLVRHFLKMGADQVCSAGLSPAFEGAQPEAVSVLKELYGVDISGHRTRDVEDMDLNRFSWIVVLDAYVFESLKERWPDSLSRMVLWDIDDPYGRPRDVYIQSARLIEYCVRKYLLRTPEKKDPGQ